MSVALWCGDCKQVVDMDRNGNCESCGSPELAVVDRPTDAPADGRQRLLRLAMDAEERSEGVSCRELVLRLAITAVLIGAVVYAWYLWRIL